MTHSATGRLGRCFAGLVAVLALVGLSSAQAAPKPARTASPFQGFSSDNGKPINVKSDSIELHQQEQFAIFTGRVVAVQGDSTLRAPKLIVYYDQDSSGKDVEASPTGAIKRLEAVGGVIITSKDQRATGSRGVFDMKTNRATLFGNVVLVQGSNVIRGKTLVVDLKTGLSRVQGGTEGRFVPGDDQPMAAKPKRKSK